MKVGPDLPISNRAEARRIALAIIRHKFVMAAAIQELWPGFVDNGSYGDFGDGRLGAQLLKEPAVMMELNKVMDRMENNAEKFLKKMWEWLDDDSVGKEQNERRQTAARILAKGYIREKGAAETTTSPMVIAGLGDGISSLTGDVPVKVETDPGKVV